MQPDAFFVKVGVGGIERVPPDTRENGILYSRYVPAGSQDASTNGLPLPLPHDANRDMAKEAAHIRDKRCGVFEYDFTIFIFTFSYSTAQNYI